MTDDRMEALIREHFFGDLPDNLDAMARNFAVAVLQDKSLGALCGALRCVACGEGPVERVFLDGVECSRCEACGIELVDGRQHDASLFRVMRAKLAGQQKALQAVQQESQTCAAERDRLLGSLRDPAAELLGELERRLSDAGHLWQEWPLRDVCVTLSELLAP